MLFVLSVNNIIKISNLLYLCLEIIFYYYGPLTPGTPPGKLLSAPGGKREVAGN